MISSFTQNAFRCFSRSRKTCANSMPKPDYGPPEVQRSTLMNGVKIAAAKQLGAQIGACTIMFQAGSRYEVDDHIGATHFVRAASSGSGCGYSSFSKMRYLQQHGAYLTCSTDRQTVCFTLRCPLSVYPDLKYYLLDTAARNCFRSWEVDDRRYIVREDLDRIPPGQLAMDLIQKASWAGPLSNSMFCPEDRIDSMSGDSLNAFARSQFRTDQCTVASFGLPYEETMSIAENIEAKREKPFPRCEYISCPRGGFESYDLGKDSDTWIAVAVPGCGTGDFCCLLKHAIIAYACGNLNVQGGQHTLDRLPQSPLCILSACDIYTDYKAFNISYMETGLFGVLVKTRAETARDVAISAAQFLSRVGDLSVKQIEIGKRRLQLDLAIHDEDCVKVSEGLALQLANNVQVDSCKNSICMIDMICPDEIIAVAKNLSTKRYQMAVAVVGDVGAVPHDRELVCGLP